MEIELKMIFPDRTCYETFISDRWTEKILPTRDKREIMMHSLYFDTQSRELESLKATARVRLENQATVLTLKRGDLSCCGVFSRQEWSAGIPRDHLSGFQSIKELDGQMIRRWFENEHWFADARENQPDALHELLDIIEDQVLTCTAEIRFCRLAARIEINGTQLETALDRGHFIFGQHKKAFSELEIELLDGESALLNEFRQILTERFGLLPETESKLARCLAFARSVEHDAHR